MDVANLINVNRGRITIHTDHPRVDSVYVYFTTEKPFVSHPSSRWFSGLALGEKRDGFVTIVSSFDEDFELGEITSKYGNIDISSIERTVDGYRIEFVFVVPKSARKGFMVDYLEIPIKGRENISISVLCRGMVETDVPAKTSE